MLLYVCSLCSYEKHITSIVALNSLQAIPISLSLTWNIQYVLMNLQSPRKKWLHGKNHIFNQKHRTLETSQKSLVYFYNHQSHEHYILRNHLPRPRLAAFWDFLLTSPAQNTVKMLCKEFLITAEMVVVTSHVSLGIGGKDFSLTWNAFKYSWPWQKCNRTH